MSNFAGITEGLKLPSSGGLTANVLLFLAKSIEHIETPEDAKGANEVVNNLYVWGRADFSYNRYIALLSYIEAVCERKNIDYKKGNTK